MRLTVLAVALGTASAGGSLARTAVLLLLVDHSAVFVSVFLFAGFVPSVVLAPMLAPAVDRVESRRLLIGTLLAQAVVSSAMAVTASLSVVAALALGFLASCLSAVNAPAMMLLAERTGDTGTAGSARVYSALDAARMSGVLAGPALGGVSVGLFGFPVTMALDAAATCVAVVLITALRLRRFPPGGGAPRPGWWRQVAEAPVVLASDTMLRVAMGSLAVSIVFTAIFTVAEVFYVRDTLGASPAVFGIVTTAFVVGRLVTSSWLAGRVPLGRRAEALVGAGMLMGLGLAGAGISHSVPGALIGFAVAGAANSLQVSAMSTLIGARVPDGVRGRAFATMGSFNSAATLLGTLLGAPVVALGGPAVALVVAGAGTLAATVVAAPTLLGRSRVSAGAAGRGAKPVESSRGGDCRSAERIGRPVPVHVGECPPGHIRRPE